MFVYADHQYSVYQQTNFSTTTKSFETMKNHSHQRYYTIESKCLCPLRLRLPVHFSLLLLAVRITFIMPYSAPS